MNRTAATAMAILTAVTLAGCAQSGKTAEHGKAASEIAVEASDTACVLSANTASTGSTTFVIANSGTKVTEFYIYAAGQRILGEAENISPGLQRRLEVRFDQPGTYRATCKPGMAGDGIHADIVVAG